MKQNHIAELMNLEVNTSIGCMLNCKYCPQDLLMKSYSKMCNSNIRFLSLDNFKKCVDKLGEGGTVTFSGMSEPFQNPSCADMIIYAYKKKKKIQLFTTLMKASVNDLKKIEKVEFSTIALHIPDARMNSKFILDNTYLKTLDYFLEKFTVSYYCSHGPIHPMLRNKIRQTVPLVSKMHNRADI